MRTPRFRFALTSTLVLFSAVFTLAQTVPQVIRYAGVAVDRSNQPVRGTTGAIFAVYAQQQGGAPLWQETQTITVDAQGHYSVLLGSTSKDGIAAEVFANGEARWLGVSIDGHAESARVQLVSVPYAMKAKEADTVGGMTSDELVARSLQQFKQQYLAPGNSTTVVKNATTAVAGEVMAPSALVNTATNFTDTTSNQVVLVTQNGTGAALKGTTASTTSNGVYGINTSTTGAVRGVYGEANSATTSSAGVFGISNATTGLTYGVLGITNSAQGTALNGTATSTTGTAIGLRGQSNATSGIGVQGAEASATGGTTGVNGFVLSPAGVAGAFDNRAGGKILSLRNNAVEKLSVDGSGNLTSSGNINATNFVGSGAGLTNVNAATVGGFSSAQLGTVKSITFGTGLTGGTITSTGSVGLDLPYLDARYLSGGGTTTNLSVTNNFTAEYPAASTPASGASSAAIDLVASSYNGTTNQAVNQTFRLQAVPNANNSASPNGKLMISYGLGTGAISPILGISNTGIITFAAGQTFPGAGAVTGATAGGGLALTGTTLGLLTCSNTQTLVFNGGSWSCGAAGGGDAATLNGLTALQIEAAAETSSNGYTDTGLATKASLAGINDFSGGNTFDNELTLNGFTSGAIGVFYAGARWSQTQDATASNNYAGSSAEFNSSVWDGSAATNDSWSLFPAIGSGPNPTTNLQLNHSSTATGAAKFIVQTAMSTGGDLTVSGAVTANSFSGNGSGLSNVTASSVDAANITGSTANINISGNAATATTAGSAATAGFATNAGFANAATTANFATTALFANTASNVDIHGIVGTTLNYILIGDSAGSVTQVPQSNFVDTSSSQAINGFKEFGSQVVFDVPSFANDDFTFFSNNLATAGSNFSSPKAIFLGEFWDGGSSANDKWTINSVLGAGTNPTSTLTIAHPSGTPGTKSVAIQAPVTVTGAVTATSFSGDGSGLTNVAASSVAAANIGPGTAGIDISGNAATATSAISAGSAAAASTATIAGSANGLQGTPVSATAPSADGQFLRYNSTNTDWEPSALKALTDVSNSLCTNASKNVAMVNVNGTWVCKDLTPAITRTIAFVGGCDSCGVLATTDSQNQFFMNASGNMTIQQVTCFADTGSPTVNVHRASSGSNLLTSDLTCSNAGASSAVFNSGEANFNVGQTLDFLVTGGSTAHRVTLVIKALLN